jgi:hypothetical protein
MKKDCSTCLCREGSCYPSITIFDKDKTCRSYTPDYEGYIIELEKKNNELKTEKIPQLEKKIASIRGAHSVDCKKLNARIEQVERLKKENAELKKEIKNNEDLATVAYMQGADSQKKKAEKQLIKAKELEKENAELKEKVGKYQIGMFDEIEKRDKRLTKAKEIILRLYNAGRDVLMCRSEEKAYDNLSEAINDSNIEQFLKEIEK